MVEVTLKFESVDLAIVALGKLVGAGGKVARSTDPRNAGQQAATVTSTIPDSTSAAPTILPDPLASKAPRKPRADKGQPRGSYAPRTEAGAAGATASSTTTAGVAGQAGAAVGVATSAPSEGAAALSTAAVVPASSTAAPGTSTEAAAGAIPSAPPAPAAAATPIKLEDAQKALATLLEKTSYEVCTGVLAGFGVARLRELAPEKFAEFVAYANDLIAKAPAKAVKS